MGRNETKTQPVPVTTRKRKRLGFDARAGTPPSGFWHVGEARSAQGNGSKGLAMSKRLRLGAWVVALVAALAVVVGGIGVAFAAAGDIPDHEKTIKDNEDGTYTVSLTVTGESEKKTPKVNVIVIVDRSGSMNSQSGTGAYVSTNQNGTNLYGFVDGEYVRLTRVDHGWGANPRYTYTVTSTGEAYTGQRYQYDATATRLQATQAAVNGLASELLSYNGADGNPDDTVEMALVTFATTSATTLNPTTSESTYTNAVNGITVATGNNAGTNWESALQRANTINFNDEDPTFVIFFSDGSPTFRVTQAGYNDRFSDGVYGTGQEEEPNMERAYTQATDDAATLANKVTPNNFYTIFAYGTEVGAGYMADLTTAAGAPATNNYSASSTAELNDAFAEILANIQEAGFADIDINDGTTNQVKASSGEMHELLEVDESSYKYYRSGGDYGTTMQEWADAPEAKFEGGSVKWDLSEEGILENGVTYTVTFDCYPSQETYDTIAKLKNGDITYDSLDSEIKKYIVDNGGGSYSLRTNTNATLTYDDTRDGTDNKTVPYTNPDPVKTDASTLKAIKEWEGGQADTDSVELTILMDDAKFRTVTLTSPEWSTSSFISYGLIKNGKVLKGAEGHDFKFAELDSTHYHWELETPTVHPMIIDGTPTMLVMVDEDHPATGETIEIDGKDYYIDSSVAGLTAVNHRRSNLNLKKIVEGKGAPEDAKFPFTLTVNNSKADDPSSTDPNTDNFVWFSIFDTAAGETVTDEANVSGVAGGPNADGYYWAKSGAKITLDMQADWNLRFINLPSGSTYTFVEGTTDGFIFVKAEKTAGEDPDFSGGQTTTGTIADTKTSYQVNYTNDYALSKVEITKEWDDADNQDGIRPTAEEFISWLTLKADGEDVTSTYADNLTVTDNEDGTYTVSWTGLARYKEGQEIEYTVTETPGEGYEPDKTTVKDGDTIVNTHVPEVTEASVKKVWDDADNQDGKRPETLTVTLSDGTEVTLNEDNEWTAKVDNLPKYAAGKEIEYTWTEDEEGLPEGYELTDTSVEGTVTTLTNSYTPEVTEASVKKVWDDADNQDGKRPETLTVTLSDGTEVTLNEDNEWTAKVDNLPKYAAGKEIEYTWTEGDMPEGYELTDTSVEGTVTTLTNSYTPEETEATVKKVWDDADNQDGKRPESLDVTLSDGQTVTLNEGNGWTATIEGLPKYAGGQEITYTWTEGTLPEGYTLSDSSADGTVTTLTNSYTPEETSATVKKVWDDAENQDGIRPASLVVTLSDGQTVTLSEGNGWEATVTGLPKYESGQEITYTWTEASIEGYELTNTSTEGTVTTLTNKHTPEETEATVKKVWDDADDQDGKRPESLDVTLSDGQTVTLNEGNGWTATIEGLPKYAGGQEITYTWTEGTLPEGYTLTGTSTEGTVTTLTNKHVPEKISVDVEKVWKDAENQDGFRPESVTVNLLANGEEADTAVLNEGNEWKYTWADLDKYAGGEEIDYTVEEVKTDVITGEDGPGTYKDEVSGAIAEGYLVTNTHTPETVDVTVKKVWDDDDNRDGKRPENLEVTLSNGDMVTLGASNNWEATIEGLPKYKAGQEIAYTWTEASIDGYELTNTGTEGYVTTLTNSHTPEQTTVTVTKTWDDADDKDGIRPVEINVTLLANGEEAGTAVLSESNGWTHTWDGLYKYEGGKEIAYTVSEQPVEGYDEPEITGTAADGYTIKNHHKATPDPVTIDPTVQKIVKGNPATPETFTFQMKAITDGAPMPEGSEGGVKTTQITGTGSDEFGVVTYTEAGEWVYEITEVDGGVKNYTYDTTVYTLTVSVEEVADGSQAKLVKTETITGGDSITFTNVYEEQTTPPDKKVPPKKKIVIPQTGDDTPTGAMAALTVFGAAALTAGTVLQRRKRK